LRKILLDSAWPWKYTSHTETIWNATPMSEKPKNLSPPYATFPTFLNFINKLRDSQVPARIDPSVFGNASGSVSYSIIAALKALKLISAEGAPSAQFVAFIRAADDERKPMFQAILKSGYPTLWDGSIDLLSTTAGQFDEHIREEYDVKGSTVDKVATFFIQAAKYADLPISPHLAARKPTASSASSAKSRRQRRNGSEGGEQTPSPPPSPAMSAKALEYELIDLMKRDGIGDPERQAIWTLVQFLTTQQKGG
jgi:hypothetical protein